MKITAYFLWYCVAYIYRTLAAQWQRAEWKMNGVAIARNVTIRRHSKDAIQIGQASAVGLGTLLIATTEMSALPAAESRLSIGAGTAINEFCNFRACGGEIRIGSKCIVAQMVTIVASNHSIDLGEPMIEQQWSIDPRSVWIGDDVWIGAGVTVLPGSRIGSGAVLAAGAVVRGLVPEGEIWGGVPARRLKNRPASDSSRTVAR